MKTYFFLFSFLVLSFTLTAQDFIVTKTGDKIDCKILSTDSVYVYFSTYWNGTTIKTMLEKEKIRLYGPKNIVQGPTSNNNESGALTTRISFYGGLGFLTMPTPDGLSSDELAYLDELRSGISVGGEITLFFTSNLGLGLKLISFNTKNSNTDGSDNITATYFGPTLNYKKALNKNLDFIFGMSLGNLNNKNEGSLQGYPVTVNGSTLGYCGNIGLDIKVGPHVAIGIDLLVLGGEITTYKVNGQTLKLDSPDDLSRIDFTGGLRFFF